MGRWRSAAGGALNGGRVIADLPGERQLHEDRDLAPTTDPRAALKGFLREHPGMDDKVLAAEVFPGSAAVRPLTGLIRT